MSWSWASIASSGSSSPASGTMRTISITQFNAVSQDGDLLVALLTWSYDAPSLPDGWEWAVFVQGDISLNTKSAGIAYLVRGSSIADTTFLVPSDGISDYGGPHFGFYRYRWAGAPGEITVGPSSTNTLATAGTGGATGALTTAAPDALIVAMARGIWGPVTNFTSSTPSGASGTGNSTAAPSTSQWLRRFSGGNSTGASGFADAVVASPGSTGTISATCGQPYRWSMVATVFQVGGGAPDPITGELDVTLAPATLDASGSSIVTGDTDTTLATLTATASGTSTVTGAADITLGTLTLTASGTVAWPGITGALSVELEPLTGASLVVSTISGGLDETLAPMTGQAVASSVVAGGVSAVLDGVVLASMGGPTVAGTLDATLDPLTGSATGESTVTGALDADLAPLVSAALGSSAITGSLAATLGDLTLNATLVTDDTITGDLNVTLGAVVLSASGSSQVTGDVDAALGGVTFTGTGAPAITADADVMLDGLTCAAVGMVSITGQTDAVLSPLTSIATGTSRIDGALNVTLAALTLEASGRARTPGQGRRLSVVFG